MLASGHLDSGHVFALQYLGIHSTVEKQTSLCKPSQLFNIIKRGRGCQLIHWSPSPLCLNTPKEIPPFWAEQ